jgi:hypothetical protein
MAKRYPEILGASLVDARDWVDDNREDGADCPCCGQYVKLYKRPINAAMCHALLLMVKAEADGETDEKGWVHVPSLLSRKTASTTSRGGDFAKLRYWGLLEESGDVRDDGSPRAGFWRVTASGFNFAEKRLKVRKYALVYNGDCLGFEGPVIGIILCLGRKFDYNEILGL